MKYSGCFKESIELLGESILHIGNMGVSIVQKIANNRNGQKKAWSIPFKIIRKLKCDSIIKIKKKRML